MADHAISSICHVHAPPAPNRTRVISPWQTPEDGFVPSAPVEVQADMRASAPHDLVRPWRVAAALGVAVLMGANGYARPVATASLVQSVSVSSSFGVEQAVLDSLSAKGAATLATIPTDMREMYIHLTPQQKKQIADNLAKHTRILFLDISHRNAFVRGNVLGVNIFDKMEKKLDQTVAEGKVNAEQAAQVRKAITMFRHISPDQRAALADLMIAEQKAHAEKAAGVSQSEPYTHYEISAHKRT